QLPQKESKSSQQHTNGQNNTQATASTPRRTVTTQNFAAVVAQQQSARCTLGSDVVLRKADDTYATKGKVDLLIGRARIWNARNEEYEEVYLILDTGADQSFITANYANHLGLKPTGSMPLTIRTFGSDTPVEKECDTTLIKIEDQEGNLHQFNVAQIDFIAGDIQRTQLDNDDRNYLAQTTLPEMIVFTDASKNAMAACVYLLHEGNVNSLMAKSELPSIKDNPTTPKLEMNALTMGTRLVNTIFNAVRIQIPVNAITIFTDSEIALGWLRNPKLDQKPGTLVRNRAREIRKITESLQESGLPVRFGYVITTNNPADVATRRVTQEEFKNHSLWWKGSAFLSWPKTEWPPQDALQPQAYEEAPCQTILTITSSAKAPTELMDWTRHSSMERAMKNDLVSGLVSKAVSGAFSRKKKSKKHKKKKHRRSDSEDED
ncbi:hypothetical protein GCK32_011868, partial [Trichostrongylus colubriformis]